MDINESLHEQHKTHNQDTLQMVDQSDAASDQKASCDNSNEDTGTHQEHIQAALELLYQHFPHAFIKEGNCKPLKIGILDDLKGRLEGIDGLSISKVRAAVRVYTTRLRYFYSVREGAMRIDLDGNEVEAVTKEHAQYARSRFSEINKARRPAKKNVKAQRNVARNVQNKNPNLASRNYNNSNHKREQFNRRYNPNQKFERRYEKAKASDIKIGRTVFVYTNNNYFKGVVEKEIKGDKVDVTLQNGWPVSINLDSVFLSQFNTNNRPPRRHTPFKRFDNKDGVRKVKENQ